MVKTDSNRWKTFSEAENVQNFNVLGSYFILITAESLRT